MTTIRLLVDMNLSPDWIAYLRGSGWDAVHWSAVGDPRAADTEIMAWCRTNSRVPFTHDLDFGTLLALTHAAGPSVLQVRGHDVLPGHMGPFILAALAGHATALASGAIVVVDEARSRVRILPL